MGLDRSLADAAADCDLPVRGALDNLGQHLPFSVCERRKPWKVRLERFRQQRGIRNCLLEDPALSPYASIEDTMDRLYHEGR